MSEEIKFKCPSCGHDLIRLDGALYCDNPSGCESYGDICCNCGKEILDIYNKISVKSINLCNDDCLKEFVLNDKTCLLAILKMSRVFGE